MHSRIFELSEKPILRADMANESDIPEWFCGYIADYIDIISDSSDKLESANWLSNFLGAFTDGVKLTITKEVMEKYFTSNLNDFLKYLEDLKGIKTIDDFVNAETGYKMHLLNGAYDDKYGFWIYEEGSLMTLDQFMRHAFRLMKKSEEDLSFYIGSVFDYHM